jgi:chromosomal replication initiation ATPase DnaA
MNQRPAQPVAPAQLVFDMPHRPASEAGDFLVSTCNAAAVEMIDRWPDWPQPSALIVAPPASGKTHLAAVWRGRANAASVAAGDLSDATVAAFRDRPSPALVVEDLDRGIASERVLFHLMNHAREARGFLLMTSRLTPGELQIDLPDLRSRVRALAPVLIAPPDEPVLAALLVKLFADRQIDVEPPVIAHLARQIERSFEAAGRIVGAVDRLALARKKKVTRALVNDALAGVVESEADPDPSPHDAPRA